MIRLIAIFLALTTTVVLAQETTLPTAGNETTTGTKSNSSTPAEDGTKTGKNWRSTPSESQIMTGKYWEPSIATKWQLGFWAAVKPERLKDVEVVYSYRLSDLCNEQVNISKPAVLVQRDPVKQGLLVDEQSLAAKSFACSAGKLEKDAPVWVIFPDKVSGTQATELLSLNPGGALKPDYSKIAVDPAKGMAAAFKDGAAKDYWLYDLPPNAH